eukprot:9518871-Alexandrium_andersonii.AAC.1
MAGAPRSSRKATARRGASDRTAPVPIRATVGVVPRAPGGAAAQVESSCLARGVRGARFPSAGCDPS